jgi:translation initiation factor 2 subunit 1
MPKKQSEWPEKGELVLGTVIRVNPYSASISLEEYKNKEGMIHISEAARKWIKDIREIVKEGQKIVVLVLNVEKEKNHITLSLKRVNKRSAEEKLREYKREQKAEKMLAQVAKETGLSLEKTYEEIGFKLQEEFGELFKAFQMSQTPQGYDLLIKKGIPDKWAKVIKQIAEKQMEIKESFIKAELELRSLKPNGVETIKKVLEDAKNKNNLEIKYISAPKYYIYLKTKDAKAGERKLKEIAEEIVKSINSMGGEGLAK